MATRGRKKRTAQTSRRTPPALAARWACPPHLTGEAAVAWDHAVKMLAESGNLARIDTRLVEAYATNCGMLRDAQAVLKAKGPVIEKATGTAQMNPACMIINAATMRIRALCTDMGVTANSSKFAPTTSGNPGADQDETDKWGDLLGVVG